jgi:N-carbamoylputrescine amidase
MKFRVALLQILPRSMDQEFNLQKGIEYCKKAKDLGANLVLFPEMWNIGYAGCPFDEEGRANWEHATIDRQSDFFQQYVELARSLQTHVALTYLEKYKPKPRNTLSIINPKGDVVLSYSKVYVCDFGMEELTKESPDYEAVGCDYNCTPGSSFDVCALETEEGTVHVGAMICADREFPEPASRLAYGGAEIILVPNACTWDGLRSAQVRVRAFDNFVGIAMANYPAPFDNGHSSAYHCAAWDRAGQPRDTLIVEAGEEEGIFLATFDVDDMRSFREMERWRLDYRGI